MKKLIPILLILIVIEAQSQIITVDNNPNSPADYTDLQEAIDAANPRDTIYVSGSDLNYGNLTFSKKIMLFGPGIYPPNQFQEPAIIGTLRLEIDVAGNEDFDASGTIISGLTISEHMYVDRGVNDLIIERNYFSFGSQSSIPQLSTTSGVGNSVNNWLIVNNIFRGNNMVGINLYDFNSSLSADNIIISNNIFSGSSIKSLESTSVIIANNLFTDKNNSNFNALSSCQKIVFANNIIYGIKFADGTSNRISSNNNISFNTTGTDFDIDRSTTANNLEGVNPLFNDEDGDFSFEFEEDYSLAPSSPGKNYGSDGTDVGIYGGAFPWPSDLPDGFKNSPFPLIPQVLELNIENSTVSENGDLNVNFRAKTSN